MVSKSIHPICLAILLTFLACSQTEVQERPGTPPAVPSVSQEDLLGRWDVTVKTETGEYPSWFEISKEGNQWKGRFVGRSGSARPIATLNVGPDEVEFSVPVQYEKSKDDLVFRGKLVGDQLEGTTTSDDGKTVEWNAVRAPSLARTTSPEWGQPIPLFNGKDLSGWRVRHRQQPNGWKVEEGLLVNTPPSNDLVTEQEFEDFKLDVEFRIPAKSNSGIYLRGRYEVQIEDNFGQEPTNLRMGGIYGFLAPVSNASKKPGEWQHYEITLLGRRVTVILNGTKVIDNQEIPGITGGALNSHEAAAGPIFLQGDHGPIALRRIVLTPADKPQG